MITLHFFAPLAIFFIFCTSLFLFLRFRSLKQQGIHEPALEWASKWLGSTFFLLYISYRIALQIDQFSRFPKAFTIFSWINWILVMGVFVFFAYAYLFRHAPKVRANKTVEIILPLVCAVTPIALYETHRLLQIEALRHIPWIFSFFHPLKSKMPGNFSQLAFFFLIVGHIITLTGFCTLGKSFSILTEARVLITKGLYRFVRHPVYVGESIVMLGCACDVPSWCNWTLVVLWLAAQRYRAFVEEQKLESVFPEYKVYRQRVGAYFPRIFRTKEG